MVLCSVLFASCDMLENHPYATKIDGKTDINTTNAAIIQSSGLKPPFKFAFITDTQGALDEMKDALDIISARGDIDFIVHGGDMTDFGMIKEFVWTRDMLEKYSIPYLTVIGNHDCLGNGKETFNYMFGPENYSLQIGPVYLMMLNTVALEYDYSYPVPDLEFIENEALRIATLNASSPGAVTHSIVVMHAQPYDGQFNNNVAKPFNYYISQLPGMEDDDPARPDGSRAKGLCLNGHNHSTSVTDIFDNGILYYQCANMAKRTFFVITVTEQGYEHEIVNF